MTEKINGQGFKATDTAGARRTEAAKPAAKEGKAVAQDSAPAGDTVNITRSGLLMSKLEEIVQSTPSVDSQRIAAIKDALASGTYEIDDARVADRMLALEREFVG